MGASRFRAYLVFQAVSIAAILFVGNASGLQVGLRLLGGWGAVVGLLLGIRQHRPAGTAAFLLFGASLFSNVSGILVEHLVTPADGFITPPSLADPFYLGIYPGLILGMALLIRRRRMGRDWTSLIDTAIITVGMGLLSWVFLIRPQAADSQLPLLGRSVLIAYPVGDIVVLALMIRLLLGEGSRSVAFRLMLGALGFMLAGDLFWAIVSHSTFEPGPLLTRVVYMNYQVAFALVGAAVLHPSVREIALPTPPESRLHPVLLTGLAVASLFAPAVLLLQALRHQVVDGVAIALCSTALFLLVLARMAQLLRRIEERNRAVRLVLDTVNEGLLRVSADGALAEERSAMIDRWFGPFSGGTRLHDYLGGIDADFATWFRLGHQALREGVLPPELCLEQLPRRLRQGAREFTVGYLPVSEGPDSAPGLLLVINDVTERILLAEQEAEQRELLAVFQGFARDRLGLLSFFQQAEQLLEPMLAPGCDLPTQRRLLHTLKGNAALVGLHVTAQLCHAAEGELAEDPVPPARPALAALRGRWRTVTAAFADLAGDRGSDVVELKKTELHQLCEQVQGGLPAATLAQRLRALRCEPAARSLHRLGNHARALARRLGKGEISVVIEAPDLRLDPDHWGPFWADLVHVVNNAVDHGLETSEQRVRAGKSPDAGVRLAAQLRGQELVIEVEDDGWGIDWDAIKRAAVARGLPGETADDLTAALLAPGVTSRAEASSTSGRGVGLAALHARVRERAGAIAVISRSGLGTCWRISFPRSSLQAHEGPELRLSAAGASPPAAASA